MNCSTAIVVPCYNEAARLELTAFDAYLRQSQDVSFVLVDDGSRDDTREVLERLRTLHPGRIAVLGLAENVGKAEAVRRGVRSALRRAPEFVGYWDADLATPLGSIDRFRSVIAEQRELLLVMGSRVGLLGRRIKRTWKRHFAGRAFATAASIVLGIGVYDTQCGAKLFRVTPETTALFDAPFCTRWIFDVEILARLVSRVRACGDFRIEDAIYEYPLERWEDVANSRLRPQDFVVAAADLAVIKWRYSRRSPRNATTEKFTIPEFEPHVAERKAA